MRFTACVNNRVYDDFISLCDRLGLDGDREVEEALISHIDHLTIRWAMSADGIRTLGPLIAPETLALIGACP